MELVIGKRYGRLLCVGDARCERGYATYAFMCECGKLVRAAASNVARVKTSSCGCLRREQLLCRFDLTGKTFGRWSVLARYSKTISANGRIVTHASWACRCSCGTERIVTGSALRKRSTTSCGCRRREVAAARIKHGQARGGRRSHVLELWHLAKTRAQKAGVPFSLKLEDIIVPAICPVFGTPLVRGIKKKHNNSPSIDRVIPTKGYVAGNIRVISYRANWLKQDASVEEMEKVINYMRTAQGV